jgi:threonine dehydratase
VLSGGNVDPLMLDEIVRRGMAAAGRYASLRVRLPDRPGYLADLLARVGRLGGNVVDVEHRRLEVSADLGPLALGSVEVALTLEARGHDHRTVMVDALRDAGYAVAEGTVEPGGAD